CAGRDTPAESCTAAVVPSIVVGGLVAVFTSVPVARSVPLAVTMEYGATGGGLIGLPAAEVTTSVPSWAGATDLFNRSVPVCAAPTEKAVHARSGLPSPLKTPVAVEK